MSMKGRGHSNVRSAFLVGGVRSGSGKTTVTLGLLAALAARGLAVQPFKCGPDFIDPTLHRVAAGRLSRNLDLRMCGAEFVRCSFARHGAEADVAVVEGVMGLFDGSEAASGSLASTLGLPVVLVVDASSMAESAAALVRGFEEFDPAVRVAGVIYNRLASDRHRELIEAAHKAHCRAVLLGFLPRDLDFAMPSRHLGLHLGEEGGIGREALARLARTVEEHIDLDALLAIATCAAVKESPEPPALAAGPARVKLAVARDRAFCFYYEDNFDLLRQAGAELVFFSPLADVALPAGVQGIYLGGGYPELHAAELAGNTAMRQAVREWAAAGGVIYAECGGLMYLTEGIVDTEGHFHPMTGVLPARSRMGKRLASLGYREVELIADTCLGRRGEVLRGHEFHYSEIEEMDAAIDRAYRLAGGRAEGYRSRKVLGSYLHLHFGATPEAAESLVRFCAESGHET